MIGTVVLDLDGVVYLDDAGIPGAAEAMRALADAGWDLLFATNNSTKTPELVARHVRERTGFAARPEQAVTSSMAAARVVAPRYRRALVVGSDPLRRQLTEAGVEVIADPGAGCEVVVVGLDRDVTYGAIDAAARAIRSGAAFIATNLDPTYPTPTGLAPGAGSIVAAIATAAGVAPISCGKPSQPFRSLLDDRIATTPVWVVGDRIDTDIALAKDAGWGSILVLSGVTDIQDAAEGGGADHVVASIVDVPAVLIDPPAQRGADA